MALSQEELEQQIEQLRQENEKFKDVFRKLADHTFEQRYGGMYSNNPDLGGELTKALRGQKYEHSQEDAIVKQTLLSLKSTLQSLADQIQVAEEAVDDAIEQKPEEEPVAEEAAADAVEEEAPPEEAPAEPPAEELPEAAVPPDAEEQTEAPEGRDEEKKALQDLLSKESYS